MTIKNRTFVGILFLISLFIQPAITRAATVSCTDLSSDLSYGSNDQMMNGNITKLQNFLVNSGYLSATPNGYFGPSTLKAVQNFQTANNISATGFIGPVSRMFIKIKTCNTPITPVAVVSTLPPVVNVTPTVTLQSQQINSPSSGALLSLGTNYDIIWNTAINTGYSIILEDEYGTGQGFIASSLYGGRNFSWKVGEVFSGNTQTNKTVTPGNYRIRIVKNSSGPTDSDMESGVFKIIAAPISVYSVIPKSVPADGNTSVVIYGSGFTNSIYVYMDGMYYQPMNISFISSDGRVIVLSIPNTVSAGTHTISLKNDYNTVNGAVSIVVTAANAQ